MCPASDYHRVGNSRRPLFGFLSIKQLSQCSAGGGSHPRSFIACLRSPVLFLRVRYNTLNANVNVWAAFRQQKMKMLIIELKFTSLRRAHTRFEYFCPPSSATSQKRLTNIKTFYAPLHGSITSTLMVGGNNQLNEIRIQTYLREPVEHNYQHMGVLNIARVHFYPEFMAQKTYRRCKFGPLESRIATLHLLKVDF